MTTRKKTKANALSATAMCVAMLLLSLLNYSKDIGLFFIVGFFVLGALSVYFWRKLGTIYS